MEGTGGAFRPRRREHTGSSLARPRTGHHPPRVVSMDPSMSSPPPPPGPAPTDRIDDVRTGLSVQAFKRAFLDNLAYVQGRFPRVASRHDHYMALAFTVRDRLLRHWLDSSQAYLEQRARTVCYFSAEYLPG